MSNQVYKNPLSSYDDIQVNNRYIDDRVQDLEYIISGGTGFVPISRTPDTLVKYSDVEGAQNDTNLVTTTTYNPDDGLELASIANPGGTLNFPATTTVIDFHNTPVINFTAVGPGVSYTAIAPSAATNANGIIIDNTLSEISMQLANATYPGIVSAVAQTFAGVKTFSSVISPIFDNASGAIAIGTTATQITFGAVAILGFMNVNKNIAIGQGALATTPNIQNSCIAIGKNALTLNQLTGSGNLAVGTNSLAGLTTGLNNVALGEDTLSVNNMSNSVAIGHSALKNSTADALTAIGSYALENNTTGALNTAVGGTVLRANITGSHNTGLGINALINSLSNDNTALGASTLTVLTTGQNNIAVGYLSGNTITTTSNNIDIGNTGVLGDSGVIRLGVVGTQLKNFQAGIRGVTPDAADGLPVYVSSTGQLCTVGTAPAGSNYTAVAPIAATDANGIIINNTLSTLTLELATAAQPGIVSTAAQTFAGVKTFSSAPTFSSLTTAGILHNSVTTGAVTSSLIVNADVHASAAIVDTKLATISTALKVSNSATTATNNDTASAIVARDGSGNFSANTIALNGIISLNTTTSTAGIINMNSSRFLHGYGLYSVFAGPGCGNFTYTGNANIAVGAGNLANMTNAFNNTAIGAFSQTSNLTGSSNTSVGVGALQSNLGSESTAVGSNALVAQTTGTDNCAFGSDSLRSVVTTIRNCAFGWRAGYDCIGSENTLFGSQAGYSIQTGSNNVCIGYASGVNLTSGSNNIYINLPSNDPSETTTCKIASIRGETTYAADAVNVVIDSTGTLGTVSSTRNTKSNIIPLDEEDNHEKLLRLQPRRFDVNNKSNIKAEHQSFGLVYDEVENNYDDLLAKNPDGSPHTLYYQHIPIMLLAEVQRLNKINVKLEERLAYLEKNAFTV